MTPSSPTPMDRTEIQALVALARGEFRAGRLAESAQALRKLLALRPDIAEAYLYLANVLLKERQT